MSAGPAYYVPDVYATFSDSTAQSILNAANAQAITYDTQDGKFGITLVNNSKISLPRVGQYAITFSAIGHNSSSSSPKWLNLFLKKNGTAVDNSSTIVSVVKSYPSTIVATFAVPCTTAGDYYEIFMAGEETYCQILSTAANAGGGGVPAQPACPSIVVAVWQIN